MFQDGLAPPSAPPFGGVEGRWLAVEPPAGVGEPSPPGRRGAERLLLEAAERAVRAPGGRLAVALHLGRLAPPAPRPHHRRIARAMLQEAAERHDGQVFPLANGDLVLLCRRPETPGKSARRGDDPAVLPETLTRLFAAEATEPERLVSLWRLGEEPAPFIAYASERVGAAEPAAFEDVRRGEEAGFRPARLPRMEGLAALAASPGFAELVQRQTAVLVVRAGGRQAPALRPLFREVSFALPALAARFSAAMEARADPYLFRHFVTHLDEQMLALLRRALAGEGPPGMRGAPALALHLNVTLGSLLSPTFENFAALCRAERVGLGVEVSLIEVVADAEALRRARAAATRGGYRLVLDGVSHVALRLGRLEALEADLVKLDWSARLGAVRGAEGRALAAALGAIGAERLVLARAENEKALLWGLAHGIERFQGRHVDMMLGAARMTACPNADGCTVGQCAERAGAATEAGRHLCRNLSLLDVGAPEGLVR